MENAFKSGYFPQDLALGMQTGWSLTEIKELNPLVKRMYLKFIRLKQEKEKQKIDDIKKDMDKKKGSSTNREQVITFVDEEDFYSKVSENIN